MRRSHLSGRCRCWHWQQRQTARMQRSHSRFCRLLASHHGTYGLYEEVLALRVGVELANPILRGGVAERDTGTNSCVVDQDIDLAERSQDAFDRFAYLPNARQVGNERLCVFASSAARMTTSYSRISTRPSDPPRSDNRRAVARPSPRAAPVRRITLSSNRVID